MATRYAPGMAWAAASAWEARRAGAELVGVEHLTAGLLAVGGEAARLLGAQGVTLATVRDRIGGSTPAPAPAPVGTHWQPTPGARAIVDWSPAARDTVVILRRLLGEPGVRPLLEADGGVATIPDSARGDDYTPRSRPVDAAILAGTAFARRLDLFVSAGPQQVAEAIADPESLRAFAWRRGATVSDEGLSASRMTREGVTTLHASLDREDETLTWVFTRGEGRHADENAKYERFTVRDAPGGSMLEREQGYRVPGALARVLHRLTGDPGGWDLVYGGHQLAAHIARAD